ncbi:hypothetical protein K474DRAFT_1706456 [Panus rudis PR-1116 ss-1]|nr:hypothetical protein K474DRAFT_1706456 [Panus rudis PR-1116 ss-1]
MAIIVNILSGAFLVEDWHDGPCFLHDLPVKFAIQHFTCARHFDEEILEPPMVDEYDYPGNYNMPLEARLRDRQPYNLFAADVHQLGHLFLTFLSQMVSDIPKLGPILEHMTRVNPQERITMSEAATLFNDIMQTDIYRPTPEGLTLNARFVSIIVRPEEIDMDEIEPPDFNSDSGSEHGD